MLQLQDKFLSRAHDVMNHALNDHSFVDLKTTSVDKIHGQEIDCSILFYSSTSTSPTDLKITHVNGMDHLFLRNVPILNRIAMALESVFY